MVTKKDRIGKPKKPRDGDILRICRHALNGAIVLSFGMKGIIANVITQANFFINWFRGLGVLTPLPEILLSP